MLAQPAASSASGPLARSKGTNSLQCGHLNPPELEVEAAVNSSPAKVLPQCGQTTSYTASTGRSAITAKLAKVVWQPAG
jgi:hypothetical protein